MRPISSLSGVRQLARRQLALPGAGTLAGQTVLLRHLKIRWIMVSLTKLSTTSICGSSTTKSIVSADIFGFMDWTALSGARRLDCLFSHRSDMNEK
jgi:hypothetical protein